MPRTRTEKKQSRAGLVALAASIVCGLVGGSLLRWGMPVLPAAAIFAVWSAVVLLAILATLPWWRSLDSMQREAQYFSWHWGGTAGAAISVVAIAAFAGVQTEVFRGAALLALGMTGGYALFWLAWMLRHRGAPE